MSDEIDAAEIERLISNLSARFGHGARSYLIKHNDDETIVAALRERQSLQSENARLTSEVARLRAGQRIIDAAVDAYDGRCTITDHNLLNAVRTYLGGRMPCDKAF